LDSPVHALIEVSGVGVAVGVIVDVGVIVAVGVTVGVGVIVAVGVFVGSGVKAPNATGTGRHWFDVLLFPSCPEVPVPQHQMPPLEVSAHV
jgi:hypothetical protein